jgi:very-short-patch-repair endonuclease
MTNNAALHTLAASQHALVARRQLTQLGFSRAAIRHRLRSGALEAVTPRVYRIGGMPETPRQLACAAVLDCASFAVLACDAAVALWAVPGYELRPPTVISRRESPCPTEQLGPIHQSTHLPDHHTTIVDNIPVTYPARTVFDLAGQPGVHPGRLARLIDTMWGRALLNYRVLHVMLEEHAQRGRPGTVLMRELLEARPPDHRPPDSNLEARVHQIVIEDGQPPLERQINVGAEHWIGRMDFVDRKAHVVVQVDSDIHHGSVLDPARDAAQTRALEQAGWIVVRVREHDVWHNKGLVQRQIRDARREGRRRQAAR